MPGAHGPLHVLAVADGEDPTPTAGVPQGSVFLCPCPSPQSPAAPSLLFKGTCCSPSTAPAARWRVWALSPFRHSWHSLRSPSLLPTAPGRPFLPPAGNRSADFIYSSVKPPAELKPAVASLGFAALDTPELCLALVIYSLPVLIRCIAWLIVSPVHHQLPSARASWCCCGCELGTQKGAEQGVRCQLVSRDLQLPRANAIGFEQH